MRKIELGIVTAFSLVVAALSLVSSPASADGFNEGQAGDGRFYTAYAVTTKMQYGFGSSVNNDSRQSAFAAALEECLLRLEIAGDNKEECVVRVGRSTQLANIKARAAYRRLTNQKDDER